jgi:hypothetical protein
MIPEKQSPVGPIKLALTIALMGAFLALVVWKGATGFNHTAAGFPPGWRCTNYGKPGASVCERETGAANIKPSQMGPTAARVPP